MLLSLWINVERPYLAVRLLGMSHIGTLCRARRWSVRSKKTAQSTDMPHSEPPLQHASSALAIQVIRGLFYAGGIALAGAG